MVNKRPVGSTVAVAAALSLLLRKLDLVDLSAEEITVLLGGIAAVVSWFTPRN